LRKKAREASTSASTAAVKLALYAPAQIVGTAFQIVDLGKLLVELGGAPLGQKDGDGALEGQRRLGKIVHKFVDLAFQFTRAAKNRNCLWQSHGNPSCAPNIIGQRM
jgi:hypothetical protein